MARTRLRGLEIAGIQIGSEVAEACGWDCPDAPVAEFQCLPRDPEVHVGLRVAALPGRDLGGERYAVGAWTFEIARRGSDWLLGLSRGGCRAQLAHFDREFRVGEVVLAPEAASARAYPLRGPLDEWIVLHRTVAGGGLVLTGSALAEGGRAIVRLGHGRSPTGRRSQTPSASWIGGGTVLLRPVGGELRLFRTPWSERIDPTLAGSDRVDGIEQTGETVVPFDDRLDAQEAAELLVGHAVVPLCDDVLLDRVLRNAQRVAAMVPVLDRGVVQGGADGPMAWRSPTPQSAFAPPCSEV
jgi:hypothetical protein